MLKETLQSALPVDLRDRQRVGVGNVPLRAAELRAPFGWRAYAYQALFPHATRHVTRLYLPAILTKLVEVAVEGEARDTSALVVRMRLPVGQKAE